MSPSKERLGLDFDDCFAPFDKPFQAWLGSEKDIVLRNRVDGVFEYSKAYPESGITEEEFVVLIGEFTLNASVDMVEPYPGVVDALEEIDKSFEVHVITARHEDYRGPTQEIIDKYASSYIKALHMPNTGKGHDTANKGTVCNDLEIVAMVDDADHNINQVIKITEGRTKGLLIKDEHHRHNGNDVHEDAIIIPDLNTVVRINEFRQEEGRWPSQHEVGSL